MLEEIGRDSLSHVMASNQPIFDTSISYDKIVSDKLKIRATWDAFSAEERDNYGDLLAFENEMGVKDLKDPELIPAKNFSLLMKEIRGRIDRADPIKPLSIEPLDYDDAVIELAESVENVKEIMELYKIRKTSVGPNKNAGIISNEATKLRNCFSQGRELFLAGRDGSLMVKPLNFFMV